MLLSQFFKTCLGGQHLPHGYQQQQQHQPQQQPPPTVMGFKTMQVILY